MSSSKLLTAGVGLVYAVVAFNQWRAGNLPMAITYSGYAFSNVGLWMVVA